MTSVTMMMITNTTAAIPMYMVKGSTGAIVNIDVGQTFDEILMTKLGKFQFCNIKRMVCCTCIELKTIYSKYQIQYPKTGRELEMDPTKSRTDYYHIYLINVCSSLRGDNKQNLKKKNIKSNF